MTNLSWLMWSTSPSQLNTWSDAGPCLGDFISPKEGTRLISSSCVRKLPSRPRLGTQSFPLVLFTSHKAFLVIDFVTQLAEKCLCPLQGQLLCRKFWKRWAQELLFHLPPFPNNKETPLTPTTMVPETKSVFNFILWRWTFMIFIPIPWFKTLSPVALFCAKGQWPLQYHRLGTTGITHDLHSCWVNIITTKWY